MRGRRAAIPPALIALVLGVAGCGGDSSGETTTPTFSVPSVTAPGIATTTTHTTGGVKPGTTTSSHNGGVNPNAPDSPTNDVPPPPGSPQEAFEKQCEQHPAACG